jgi:hypothetical protein
LLEQRLTRRLAAAAARHSDASRRASSGSGGTGGGGECSGPYAHWVQLLEGWAAMQVGALRPGAHSPRACVVLALAPLHESLARMLARRRGRGLPVEAVRGLARQALAALDVLHRQGRLPR